MSIEEMIQQLQQQELALGDGRDCQSDNQKAEHYAKRKTLANTIGGLRNVPNDLEKPLRLLAERQEARAAVLDKETEITQALANAPDLASIADRREREAEARRQQQLRQRLALLRDGRLLYAPGQTYERLGDIDKRIAELQERIAGLRAKLASYLQDAEVLLGETVSS